MICDVERGQFVRRLSGRAGETLAHVVEEVDAAHEFHRKEPTRAVGHQLEEGDEIWMRDICEGAKLTFETIEIIGGGAHERLERDDALALAVVSFVNDAHAARAQTPTQLKPIRAPKILARARHVSHQPPAFSQQPKTLS